MYQQEFPHEELPEGVIHLSRNKSSKVVHLVKKYIEVGFTGFDLIELAGLSLGQWKRRDYPIPKGYKPSWGSYLTKKLI